MIKPKEIFVLSVILFFLCSAIGIRQASFAQTSASQMERTQEMMQKNEALRKKITEQEKSFIKMIIVQGVALLSEDEIKRIVSPFQKHWLTHYFVVQPSVKVQEVLAMYVEYKLRRTGQNN